MPREYTDEMREYFRQYRLRNLDKKRKQDREYYQANRERLIEYGRAYYQANKERAAKTARAYCIKNADKVKERGRQYYIKNRERIRAQSKEYRARTKEEERQRGAKYRAENKDSIREWARRAYEQNPQHRLRLTLRKRLNRAIEGIGKVGSAVALLGCSIEDAVKHLESQFQPGMTWANHNKTGWHIDHIVPMSAFDLTDPEQVARACHYTNLRPLWAFDNLSKGNKREAA